MTIDEFLYIICLQVVATDASLDKIVADFIKVEDQNFALFNYVTEMNSQVESSQETIAKFRYTILLLFPFPELNQKFVKLHVHSIL